MFNIHTKKKVPTRCRILHSLKFPVVHCNSDVNSETETYAAKLIFMWYMTCDNLEQSRIKSTFT